MTSPEMRAADDESTSEEARHIAFEACFNFRDLGGYETDDGRRVRWNVLYRSDTLHRLTAADIDQFDALGLRTVIDLRSTTEVDDHGRLTTTSGHLAWHHVPMLDNVKLEPRDPSEITAAIAQTQIPGEGYLRIVEEFGGSLSLVFQLLSGDDALPAVFHCTAGKDRTGIVAALLLDLLGVPDDVIAADYVLTERARARSTVWIEANEPAFAALLAQVPPERRVISAETILGLLDGVRSTYGSAAELLLSLGVQARQLDVLRSRLLEGEHP
jgi:protein-tyrosine phosphatase